MKKLQLVMGALLIGLIAACSMDPSGTPGSADEVETVMSQYYDNVGTYQYAALRAMYTSDFEILDDGYRFDENGFEELLKRLESSALTWNFTLSEFNTKMKQGFAYTSYLISDVSGRSWFGSAILQQTDDGWLIDRMSMITQAEPEESSP